MSVEPSGEKSEAVDDKDIVTPWEVHAYSGSGIDYDKLIVRFGSSRITQEIHQRFQEVTHQPINHLLKREIFFSHREVDELLNGYEKGNRFYLYTGRGPSSEAMHAGHLIPFIFTKWLQDTFNVPLVIQLTDDEKYLWKGLGLQEARHLAHENAKDIVALGFDLNKTLIVNDLDFISRCPVFYYTMVTLERCITYAQAKDVAHPPLNESDSIGRIAYPPMKCAASVSCAVQPLLKSSKLQFRRALIICANDSFDYDCFTRLLRPCYKDQSKSSAILAYRPVHGLLSVEGKMNTKELNSAIYLKDSVKQIKNKVNKYAFSGGGATQEEHIKNGGNCQVDVAFQLLRYLLHDENKLTTIEKDYSKGDLLTGFLKKELVDILCELFTEVNERRSTLSDDDLNKFFSLPDEPEETFIMDELFAPGEAVGVASASDSSSIKDLLEKFNVLFKDSCQHPILSRQGLLTDHRDFDQILQLAKDNKTSEFYLFYSHCPSSDSLHLGEIIPLLFVKWLQKCLGDVQVVIHITDDEHYMQQTMAIEAGAIELSKQIGQENKKDIVALGFDPKNTIVFTSFEIMTPFYENICRVQRRVTYNQVKGIFGFTEADWIGKIGFPAVQAAPSFSSGFPEIFEVNNMYCQSTATTATEEAATTNNSKGKKKSVKKTKEVEPTTKSNVTCLIPCAIDQDPYFRMTRDVAPRLGLKKPCLLHSTFFPALQGGQSKMSASEPNSAIFVTDTVSAIQDKIENHASCDLTNFDNDVCYQYLRHFHPSEEKLEELKNKFKEPNGVEEKLLKKELIDCLVPQLTDIQKERSKVTDEVLMPFLRRHTFTF